MAELTETKKQSKSDVQILTWKEAREKVRSVNPDLAAIVDMINPGSKFKLYSVKYPYGEMVFKKGDLNLPNTTSIKVRENLSYRTIPIGMVLKNSLEVHAEEEQRIVPLTTLVEGTVFGIWEMFDSVTSYFVKLAWSVSSGTRSIFLLPPISNRDSFLKLKKEFNISNPPNKIKDHWKIFKQIAQSSFNHTTWYSEVLFFSKEWIEEIEKNGSWKELKLYLYQQAWKQSMFWRFSSTMNLVWQSFAQHLSDINLRFCSSTLETLKHIITIGLGELPSFSSRYDKNLHAPIYLLQKAFLDIYKIDYIPTIMIASHLTKQKNEIFGYYSCNSPTFIETSHINKGIRNALANIKEIQNLFIEFKEEVLQNKIKVNNTPIYNLINHSKFEFIHTCYDESLTLSAKLPVEDKSLLIMPEGYTKKEFYSGSHFFKGCIRIKK